MNTGVYIHEYVNIIGQNRAKYFHHITTVWGPQGRKERQQICAGVWGTVGSTGYWPQVVNLWEHKDWSVIAKNFAHETSPPDMQDPTLRAWWTEAQQFRSGGFDRLLIAAPFSPTVRESIKNKGIVGAKVFHHEIVNIAPGQALTFLDMLEQEWVPVAKTLGLTLAGAYRTAHRNDSEVVLIWAIRDWATWGRIEAGADASEKVSRWRRCTQGLAIDWIGHLMCSAPASPLQTGKIL